MRSLESSRGNGSEPENNRALFDPVPLENLYEVAPDAIFVTDSNGIIRGANPRSEELFGYNSSELVGHSIEILVPERLRSGHRKHREHFQAEPRIHSMGAGFSPLGLRKNGVEFPVDILLRPVETPAGPMILSFVRDETENRLAQEETRRLDQQMRAVVENVSEYAVYMLDRDGVVLTWNPGAVRIKGYTAEEIIGKHYALLFTADDVEHGVPAELLRLAAQNGAVECEGWRVRKDGTRFWVNAVLTAIYNRQGEIVGFSKVARDFTGRKKATEAMLLQLSAALLINQDIDALFGAISEYLQDVVVHDLALIGFIDRENDQVVDRFIRVPDQAPAPEDVRFRFSHSHLEEAMRRGVPVRITDLQVSSDNRDSLHHLIVMGMKSACCAPLLYAEEEQGTLIVASRTENAFSAEDARMLMEASRQIAVAVHNARRTRAMAELQAKLTQQKKYLEEEINLQNHFEDIVGESTGLRQVLQKIETVAPTDATVLIEGETGTGKELLARAIHRLSRRNGSTFVKLNCAAIPSGLIESELFGHEKGAFTGAIARKIGKMELAHEGSLFLDEVGELPLDLQPKLLRALQEREFERLGSNHPVRVDVRLIVATNRNLAEMVAAGKFRSDLYYRLKVFPVVSPPLRERATDIPALVRHFVATHSRRIGRDIRSIPGDTMQELIAAKWPGNIRELENFIERAVILTHGTALQAPLIELRLEQGSERKIEETLAASERELILRILRETRGQIGGQRGAAARLGVKRTTLHSKMKKLHIERVDYISS